MPGNITCSEDLGAALSQSFNSCYQGSNEQKPVIFVMSVRNQYAFHGIRIGNESYSAYPNEKQILMKEGCEVYVLKVEEVKIENDDETYRDFNG